MEKGWNESFGHILSNKQTQTSVYTSRWKREAFLLNEFNCEKGMTKDKEIEKLIDVKD